MMNFNVRSLVPAIAIALGLVSIPAQATLHNYFGRLKVTAYQLVGTQTVETHSLKGRLREANIVTHEGESYLQLVGSSGECSIEMPQENAIKLVAIIQSGQVLDFTCFADNSSVPASQIHDLYTTIYTIEAN